MKNKRFQYAFRQHASKLHKKLGEILRMPPFNGFKVYQEYPVERILASFPNGRCKFDWVIQDLKIVIECHGEFHYKPIKIDHSMTDEEVARAFRELQERDELKKQAALDAGYTYLVIPYWDQVLLSTSYLLKHLSVDALSLPLKQAYTQKKQKKAKSEWEEKLKEKAKEWKHKQYILAKQRRIDDAVQQHRPPVALASYSTVGKKKSSAYY